MLCQHTGKGTFWELRVRAADPSIFETFVRDELERFVTSSPIDSILLIRGDTTSEGIGYLMLLDGVLEGHEGVITEIAQHFTTGWKPLGVRVFNDYGEEKNIIRTAYGYGQESYGQEK